MKHYFRIKKIENNYEGGQWKVFEDYVVEVTKQDFPYYSGQIYRLYTMTKRYYDYFCIMKKKNMGGHVEMFNFRTSSFFMYHYTQEVFINKGNII